MDQINEHSDSDSDSDSDSIERTGDKDWNSLCCCNRKSSDDPWLHTEFICGLHCLSVHQFRLHRRYVVKDLTAYYSYEIQVNWKCYIDYICYIESAPIWTKESRDKDEMIDYLGCNTSRWNIYICVCMCVRACVRARACVCACVRACGRMNVRVCMYVCMYSCTYVCVQYMHICLYVCMSVTQLTKNGG